MNGLTTEELDRMEELAKAAAPGPWDVFADVDLCVYSVIGPAFAPIAVVRTRTIDDPPAEDDDGGHSADFAASSLIVALRNAAPALIAAARENAKLRAVVEAARATHDAGVDPRNGPAGKALAELALALSALDAKENA